MVENTSDVGLSHDLAFVSKYRDLCVLRRELSDMEAARKRMVETRGATLSPPPPRLLTNGGTSTTGSGSGSGGGGGGASASATVPSVVPLYQSAIVTSNAGGLSSSSLAVAVSGDLTAYEERVRSLSRSCLEIVVRLIAFRVAPKKFWFSVLNEVVPLLERPTQPQLFPTPINGLFNAGASAPTGSAPPPPPPPLLSVHDTNTLLAALQDVMHSHRRSQWLASNHITDAMIQRIRLALMRTLSQAIQQREETAEQRDSDSTLRAVKAANAAVAATRIGMHGMTGLNGMSGAPAPAATVLSRITQSAITASFNHSNGTGSGSSGSGGGGGGGREPFVPTNGLLSTPEKYGLPLPLQSAFNRRTPAPTQRAFVPFS